MIRFTFLSYYSYGKWLSKKQEKFPRIERDYSYIENFRKAFESETNPESKEGYLHQLQDWEAVRDFHTGSMRQIDHLIQFDNNPNIELKEARCEIYKISISFKSRSKTESSSS